MEWSDMIDDMPWDKMIRVNENAKHPAHADNPKWNTKE
jgi:hypothetical protein